MVYTQTQSQALALALVRLALLNSKLEMPSPNLSS